jgi:hypothetical protein
MRRTAKKRAGLQKPGTTMRLPGGREIISIIFADNPKVLASAAVKGGQPVIRPKKIVATLT